MTNYKIVNGKLVPTTTTTPTTPTTSTGGIENDRSHYSVPASYAPTPSNQEIQQTIQNIQTGKTKLTIDPMQPTPIFTTISTSGNAPAPYAPTPAGQSAYQTSQTKQTSQNLFNQIMNRLLKTSENSQNLSAQGNLAGGLQQEGQIIQNIGQEIQTIQPKETNPLINKINQILNLNQTKQRLAKSLAYEKKAYKTKEQTDQDDEWNTTGGIYYLGKNQIFSSNKTPIDFTTQANALNQDPLDKYKKTSLSNQIGKTVVPIKPIKIGYTTDTPTKIQQNLKDTQDALGLSKLTDSANQQKEQIQANKQTTIFNPLTLIKRKQMPILIGAIVKGAGETVESTGMIVEYAQKPSTYETIYKASKKTGKYFIDVGKNATINEATLTMPAPGIILPKIRITPNKKNQEDATKAGILIGTVGVNAATNFTKNPIEESGKLLGSGTLIGGATSITNKLLGLGKAGTRILQGGKYIKYETQYETNAKNLLQGKYKKGTPISTIKEYTQGTNTKVSFHSTGNDFLKKGKGKVTAPEYSPASDPPALFASTGKANEVYLRVSGEGSYNMAPRIPFINMPTPSNPTTYRLIGTTKPKRLINVQKFSKLEKGKEIFTRANTSKNVPYTSPANELKIKAENEALLRPGANLTTKGIKGTKDFTFVKGVFVNNPRVRVMPSKPLGVKGARPRLTPNNNTTIINKPKKPSITRKPKKEISFTRSIEQSRNPGTFYNPSSIIRIDSKTSNRGFMSRQLSTSTSRITPRQSISSSSNSSSESRITSRPNISSSRKSSSESRITPRRSSSSNSTSTSRSSSSSSSSSSSNNKTIYNPDLIFKPGKYEQNAPNKKYKVQNIIKLKTIYTKPKPVRLF